MNMRRRRSSPTGSSIAASRSTAAIFCLISSSRPSSSCLRSSRVFRRQRSIARCLALALRPELGSQLRPEVVRLEHLANLDLGPPAERGALEPLDRLLLRLHLPEPEAGD